MVKVAVLFLACAVPLASVSAQGSLAQDFVNGVAATSEQPATVETTETQVSVPPPASKAKSCPAPKGWFVTSADHLSVVAQCMHGADAAEPDPRRVALVQDVMLKARAYVYLNKGTFWFSVLLAVVVLSWPAVVAVLSGGAARAAAAGAALQQSEGGATPATARKLRWYQRPATTAAIQTSITGLAALSFAFYAQYKGKQVEAENLMREIIYAETFGEAEITAIIAAIAEMDEGFGFTTVEGLAPAPD